MSSSERGTRGDPGGRRQTFSDDPAVERSLRHSLHDGVAFAAMGGLAENYFAAFAVFLRANAAQIGLLAALPPLLAAGAQLLSVWFGRVTGWRRGIIVFGACVQAAVLLPLVLLPVAFPDWAVSLLIVCAVIYFVGPNLGAPLWGSLMGDLVPEHKRGRFFATRTGRSSLAGFGALLAAGGVLQFFEQQDSVWWGFFTIFGLAAGLRLVSAWHLQQMIDPPQSAPPEGLLLPRRFWTLVRTSHLVRFSLFFASMQFAVSIAGPYFALYQLRDLQFSYVAFTLSSATSVATQFLTLSRWGRITDAFGNRLVLRTTGTIIPFVPLLWLASPNFGWILFVQAVSGFCWAGFTLAATNTVFELTPRPRRAALMAWHNLLAAMAVFAGASIGGGLGMYLPTSTTLLGETYSWSTPLYGVMVLSVLVRVAVSALFLPHLPERRRVRRMTRMGVIFRVTRFYGIAGLGFETVLPTLRRGGRRRDDLKGESSGNSSKPDRTGEQ